MKQADVIDQVKKLVESLQQKRSIDRKFHSGCTKWMINGKYIPGREQDTINGCLKDCISENGSVEHLVYSVETGIPHLFIVTGNFLIHDNLSECGYKTLFEIEVVMDNRQIYKVSIRSYLKDPVIAVIEQEEDFFHILRDSEVMYIESSHNHTIWHGRSSEFTSVKSLKNTERELPEHYLKIHRCYIVNIMYIRSVNNTEIVMANGDRIPMPVRKQRALRCYIREFMNDYLKRSYSITGDCETHGLMNDHCASWKEGENFQHP